MNLKMIQNQFDLKNVEIFAGYFEDDMNQNKEIIPLPLYSIRHTDMSTAKAVGKMGGIGYIDFNEEYVEELFDYFGGAVNFGVKINVNNSYLKQLEYLNKRGVKNVYIHGKYTNCASMYRIIKEIKSQYFELKIMVSDVYTKPNIYEMSKLGVHLVWMDFMDDQQPVFTIPRASVLLDCNDMSKLYAMALGVSAYSKEEIFKAFACRADFVVIDNLIAKVQKEDLEQFLSDLQMQIHEWIHMAGYMDLKKFKNEAKFYLRNFEV